MCLVIFSTMFVWNISHSENNSSWIFINLLKYSCKLHVICIRFKWNLNFLNRFRKILISNFMKICPVGAKLLHADRKTDMGKLIVAFRNFPNTPTMKKKAQLLNWKWFSRKQCLLLDVTFLFCFTSCWPQSRHLLADTKNFSCSNVETLKHRIQTSFLVAVWQFSQHSEYECESNSGSLAVIFR